MTWQPIETAPEHADRILVWVADGGRDGEGAMSFGYIAGYRVYAVGYSGDWDITHWMPLPEAPDAP